MYEPTDPPVCPACGETHELTIAERFFLDECDRRGLPTDPLQHPEAAVSMVRALSATLMLMFMSRIGNDATVLPYYAAALAALSRAADHHADRVFAAALAEGVGDIPVTDPDAEW